MIVSKDIWQWDATPLYSMSAANLCWWSSEHCLLSTRQMALMLLCTSGLCLVSSGYQSLPGTNSFSTITSFAIVTKWEMPLSMEN